MLIHIAWGVLCILTAVTGRKRFVAVALPMGLVDALVPFSGQVSLVTFEAIIFTISIVCFGIALVALKTIAPKASPAEDRIIGDAVKVMAKVEAQRAERQRE